MIEWIKPLRLPICLLASLLTVASFRITGGAPPAVAVIAVLVIACATMLQNDWRDRYHDERKGKLFALQHQTAFLLAVVVFWTVSLGLIIIAAAENLSMGMMLLLMASAGLIYSETYRIPSAPVLVVSLTSASPALLPMVAGGVQTSAPWLLFLSMALCIFGREISKDLSDEKIDMGYKWTFPIAIGTKRASILAAITLTVGVVLVMILVSRATFPGALMVMAGALLLVYNHGPDAVSNYLRDLGVTVILLTLILVGN